MKKLVVWGIALLTFAAVLTSGALIVRSMSARDAADAGTPAGPDPTPTEVIVLDPPYDRMQFAPPGPDDVAGLTAEEALAVFNAVAPDFVVPEDATAQLGLYTVVGIDGEDPFRDRLAWGFSWQQCPISLNPNFTPAPDDPCIFWLFLDANTGEMLVAQSQR